MEVPDEQDQEPVQMEAPRFMAVVWGSGQGGDGPTTIVQLDGQGGLIVVLGMLLSTSEVSACEAVQALLL